MNIKSIVIPVAIFLVLYLLFKYKRSRTGYHISMFDDAVDGRKRFAVDNKSFRLSQPDKGLSFSCSFWMFVKDWNYRYMNEKIVFEKGGFKCLLKPNSNDLMVEIPMYGYKNPEQITFKNIPLQKWVSVCIVLENRYIDLWLNGELYQSRHLKNLPLFIESEPLQICPNRGFDGFLSKFYYWDYPLTKKIIYRVFDQGPIDNGIFSKLFNKILKMLSKVKISVEIEGENTKCVV